MDWGSRDNDEVTEQLGPYRLVTRIGEGGMGVVYLGLDEQRRTVAVKILRPHVAADDVSRARLAREVETMRQIASPHVAEVLDADLNGERPYIVTRYVQGRTLHEVVRHDGPLAGTALVRVARGLADALAAIHAAGIVHRDVKPSNVVLVDGEPVIIDFGVAQAADATRLTQTGAFIGTPAYVAPEIIKGGAPVSGTDVHAWGGVVAFAATGRPPFGSGSYEHVFSNVAQGNADISGVPKPMVGLVRAALARDPASRPPATWLRERAASMDQPGGRRARLGRWAAAAGAWAAGGSAAAGAGSLASYGPGGSGPPPADQRVPGATPQPAQNYARTRAYTGQGGPGAAPYTNRPLPRDAPPDGQAWAPGDYRGTDYGGTRPYTAYRTPYPPYPPYPPYEPPPPYGPHPSAVDLPPAPYPERYPPPPAGRPPASSAYPRPRRPRPLVGWLLLLLAAGFVAIAPALGVITVAVVVLVLRTTDGVATSLAARRSRRGPRDVDPVLSVAGVPWHALWGAVATVVQLVVPVLSIVAVGGLLLVGGSGVTTAAAALAGCAFVLLTFFGPGGRKPRQRAAGTLSLALRGRTATIITIIVVVLLIMLELSSMQSRVLIWWPLEPGLVRGL